MVFPERVSAAAHAQSRRRTCPRTTLALPQGVIPCPNKFLGFLARDITSHRERLRVVDTGFVRHYAGVFDRRSVVVAVFDALPRTVEFVRVRARPMPALRGGITDNSRPVTIIPRAA